MRRRTHTSPGAAHSRSENSTTTSKDFRTLILNRFRFPRKPHTATEITTTADKVRSTATELTNRTMNTTAPPPPAGGFAGSNGTQAAFNNGHPQAWAGQVSGPRCSARDRSRHSLRNRASPKRYQRKSPRRTPRRPFRALGASVGGVGVIRGQPAVEFGPRDAHAGADATGLQPSALDPLADCPGRDLRQLRRLADGQDDRGVQLGHAHADEPIGPVIGVAVSSLRTRPPLAVVTLGCCMGSLSGLSAPGQGTPSVCRTTILRGPSARPDRALPMVPSVGIGAAEPTAPGLYFGYRPTPPGHMFGHISHRVLRIFENGLGGGAGHSTAHQQSASSAHAKPYPAYRPAHRHRPCSAELSAEPRPISITRVVAFRAPNHRGAPEARKHSDHVQTSMAAVRRFGAHVHRHLVGGIGRGADHQHHDDVKHLTVDE